MRLSLVARASPSIPEREIDAVGERLSGEPWSCPMSRPAEAQRCFLCLSPTLRPWITDRRLRTAGRSCPTWRGFGARVPCRAL